MPLVSVIIPNWNGIEHLPVCLESLRDQQFANFEVILADNGSTDGSVDFVQREYPEVRLLALGENRGFTGACNAGIHAAHPSAKIIILLNNDTEADPKWLAAIVDGFDRYPDAGSIASKMLLFDHRDRFHNAGDYTTLNGLPGNRGVWQQDTGQFEKEERVFSACGGAAAYRKKLLEEIGILDNDFFFSGEDVDMGWRANLAGWQVIYIPTAIVYHKLKASGGDIAGSYYDGRNFIYLLAKNYPSFLFKQEWRRVLGGQFAIAKEALKHWRGAAARAKLRGQLAGILGLPKMWRKRKAIQNSRRLSDEKLMSLLNLVDESQTDG